MSQHLIDRAHVRSAHGEGAAERQYLLINLGALALALCWFVLIGLTINPGVDDFKIYWRASVSFLRSEGPYAPGIDYIYPPLLVYLIQPLGLLDQRQAQWIWFGVNSIALSGLIVLCIRLSGSRLARRYWGAVVLGMLLAPPTRLSLQLGQVSILLSLMIVGSVALARRNMPIAGLLLALASLIKLYPVLLGVYYLLHRIRSVAWWAIMTGMALLAASVMAYGVEPYTTYVHVLLKGAYSYTAEFNISLFGFWGRLLSTSRYAVPLIDLPMLAQALFILTGLGILSICFWAGRGAADDLGRQLECGVWLCGMMLLSPLNGYYNLVLVLPLLLVLLRYLEQHPHRGAHNWLIVGTALICVPPAWSNWLPALYNTTHVGWGLLLLTPAIYGLCIYLGLLALLARTQMIHRSDAAAPLWSIAPEEIAL